jgi:hypothetical protein
MRSIRSVYRGFAIYVSGGKKVNPEPPGALDGWGVGFWKGHVTSRCPDPNPRPLLLGWLAVEARHCRRSRASICVQGPR